MIKGHSGQYLVFTLLLTTVGAVVNDVELDDYTKCNNGRGICVRREICVHGAIDTEGQNVIAPRISECPGYDWVCCLIPKGPSPVTTRATTRRPTTRPTTAKPMTKPPTMTAAPLSEAIIPHDDRYNECGVRANNVDEGSNRNVNRNEFPWIVGVYRVKGSSDNPQEEFICGGSLIDSNVVVTTAVCVRGIYKSSLRVKAGLWERNVGGGSVQVSGVENVTIHSGYAVGSKLNNIALLYLGTGFHLGSAVNRVCWPQIEQSFPTCYIVGWDIGTGPSSMSLHKYEVWIAETADCLTHFQRMGSAASFQLPKQTSCTVYASKDIPQPRASGTGLYCATTDRPNQYFLVGIASEPMRNNNHLSKDVFLQNAHYTDWLDSFMIANNKDTAFYRPND